VTQLLVVAAAAHLLAGLVMAYFNLVDPSAAAEAKPWGLRLAEEVRAISYSVALFGGAASVEFLFRIWTEL